MTYLAKVKPDSSGEIQLTNAIDYLIKDKKLVLGLKLDGNYFDCGEKLGFIKANLAFAKKDPTLKKDLLNFLKTGNSLIFSMKNIFSFFKKTLDIHLIETEENFEYIKNTLNREKIFGIDTEFDWRTTYFPKLSLLQISVSKEIILIDCIKCKKLNFLKSILENKDKLFIFHSARSDATVLSNNLDVKIKNIFDTQAAEKLLNSGTVESYASLVKKYSGKDLDKSETNSNWLKRPLTENQISYASSDVEYLIKIYKIQKKLLTKETY